MMINSTLINYTNRINNNYKNTKNDQVVEKSNMVNTSLNKDYITIESSDITSIRNNRPSPSGLGVMDKGTAKETTINVDRDTFFNILNYAVSDVNSTGFDECGMDENKRWVVVNGQRFECELTEREKELIKKAKERNNLLFYLNESDKKIDERKNNDKVELSFNNGVANLSQDSKNPKIQNLLKNDKVMEMLNAIANSKPISLYS